MRTRDKTPELNVHVIITDGFVPSVDEWVLEIKYSKIIRVRHAIQRTFSDVNYKKNLKFTVKIIIKSIYTFHFLCSIIPLPLPPRIKYNVFTTLKMSVFCIFKKNQIRLV